MSEDAIRAATLQLSRVDAASTPHRRAAARSRVLAQLVRDGRIARDAEVVVFNTGSGASYRF